MRRGEYKCRILEMHLKLKDQQLKTILFIYTLLDQNLMVTANLKSTIDTHTKRKKESKHNTKVNHHITEKRTKEEGKKKDLQKQIQSNSQNGNNNIHIDNYLKCNGLNDPTKKHRLAE